MEIVGYVGGGKLRSRAKMGEKRDTETIYWIYYKINGPERKEQKRHGTEQNKQR